MEHIIVSLRKEDGQELDLEVPREVRAADLVEELALSFGLSGAYYQIHADPPNRLLAPHETLAQAGVWDGARLTLTWGGHVPSAPSSVAPPPAPNLPPVGGPVAGWRPLDLGGQPPPSAPASPPSSGGFTWKRIDED